MIVLLNAHIAGRGSMCSTSCCMALTNAGRSVACSFFVQDVLIYWRYVLVGTWVCIVDCTII
jgi:hypothetical protein